MINSVQFPLDEPEISFETQGGGQVRRSILPSGIRVLTERVPGSASATIGFWVAVGSRDEAAAGVKHPSTFGSTHFLEHLLFKGTPSRSALDIAIAFDEVGGEHNALTSKEYTCYYGKVRDQDLPMAVNVLADMFTSALIDKKEFETERTVILEELAMSADDPADQAGEEFYAAVFGDHPLGRPIGGTAATIRAVNREAVWEHYQQNYLPRDLIVTVAGSVDHDTLLQQLTAALKKSGWKMDDQSAPRPRRNTVPAKLTGTERLRTIDKANDQVNLYFGCPGLTLDSEQRFTMTILNSVLGSGMSSRLFQEIREKRGLAYSVYSFASGYADAGIFGMYAGCAPKNAKTVIELMREELVKLAKEPVTALELKRAQGKIAGATALALEDSDTRMTRLGRAELQVGEFLDLEESLHRIALVDPGEVQTLAQSLLDSRWSLAGVGPVANLELMI